ncbi:hypothetical protein IEO21_08079 [Rhodonia placenta]|uniref:Uncharacterized protein n=1 Tax=Rhodonia placenta TaxID=104341 RepID=A0A8H7TZQ9_9APHY|nr:hypothetical protein IEO21_08079 [Postia placenta]
MHICTLLLVCAAISNAAVWRLRYERDAALRFPSFSASRRTTQPCICPTVTYKGGMPTQAASASYPTQIRGAAWRLHASSPQPPRADIQVPYTLGPNIAGNLYHVPILRDEIVCAFGDAVGMSDEWKAVPAMEVVMDVVARTSNRLSVSLTFSGTGTNARDRAGRNADYFKLVHRIARRLLTKVPQRIARVMKHLQPMIEERGKDWQDKPNDLLQWLTDTAQGEERTMRALVLRVLTVNIVAIHTSSLEGAGALQEEKGLIFHVVFDSGHSGIEV